MMILSIVTVIIIVILFLCFFDNKWEINKLKKELYYDVEGSGVTLIEYSEIKKINTHLQNIEKRINMLEKYLNVKISHTPCEIIYKKIK
ncbi:MAG: hypothetical protein KAJ48_07950 [Elusimicrobiales bacterium]|nr:hypothetical protein [Elusimicrobiales bacterium]